MKHIKEYQKGEGGVVLMSNGKSLEVSRRKKEHFITFLKKYFAGNKFARILFTTPLEDLTSNPA